MTTPDKNVPLIDEVTLKIVQDEYEKLWAYYIQCVQERFKLFDWYFKIVTIPFTIITSITFLVEKKNTFVEYLEVFGLVLMAIFLLGLCIYITYAKQNAITAKYDLALNKIREFYQKRIPDISDILNIDNLRKSKGRFGGMGSVKYWRGLIIVLFNSIIFSFSILLIFSTKSYLFIISSYIFSIILHIIIYRIMKSNYMNRSSDKNIVNES